MSSPRLVRLFACAFALVTSLFGEEAPKKVGIIGLDTSHVVAFTTVFNKGPKNPADAPKFAGFRVTHAYAQGSKDIPESTSRVPEYTDKLKGIPMGGVMPTYQSVSDFSYPGARPLYIYVKAAHLKAIKGIKEFANEFAKAWAQRVI